MAGYFWANFAGRKIPVTVADEEIMAEETSHPPSVIKAFLPVVVPIVLIAARSFFTIQASAVKGWWFSALLSLGDPVIALAIGVLLAFNCHRPWDRQTVGHLLQEAAEKAGSILVIIGAGGAFGAVLAATDIGRHFSQTLALDGLGILFPFLITSVLKTAQGSSTVAIITAASIVQPLLPALGLATRKGQLLCRAGHGRRIHDDFPRERCLFLGDYEILRAGNENHAESLFSRFGVDGAGFTVDDLFVVSDFTLNLPVHILIAPNAFKNSLDATAAAEAIRTGIATEQIEMHL